MFSLSQSVEQSLKYAAFFHLPLTDETLHHWLIVNTVVSSKTLKQSFPQKLSPRDQQVLTEATKLSQQKLILAQKVVRLFRFFPTILMVALTGSVAIDNAKPDDDIDLMIITTNNSLWLTRLFLIPLVGLFFKRRLPNNQISNFKSQISNSFCFNLWLDQSALAVPANKRNLYTAHEVLQVKPLFDRGGIYHIFIEANSWTRKYLANAYKSANSKFPSPKVGEGGPATAGGEVFLRFLNSLAFKFQYSYMKSKITHETITLHSAYFHPRNLSLDIDRYLY